MRVKRWMLSIAGCLALSSAYGLDRVPLGECELPRLAMNGEGQFVLTQACERATRFFTRQGKVAHSWVRENESGNTTIVEAFCDAEKLGIAGWIAWHKQSGVARKVVLDKGSTLLDSVCRGPSWQ